MPPELKDAVLHFLSVFDVCRINRKQLTHFVPTGGSNSIVFKSTKSAVLNEVLTSPNIPSDVETLRRVAEEIDDAATYIASISNCITYHKRNPLSALSGEQPSLPTKPPVPAVLWTNPYTK